LPSVAKCLQCADGEALQREFGSGLTALALRRTIDELRQTLQAGKPLSDVSLGYVLAAGRQKLQRWATPLGRRAVNATGILLHTGLGRAPLSESALAAIAGFGRYSLLEIDQESGERGKREERVEALLQELTGCEAATVVNNNAAATYMVLRTLAGGREVIISRGQLIEIGGSFRMPDVMAESGCILKEVGTTNRTHLKDYERALSERTGALMHVHTSNYRIHGFSSTPDVVELCRLGARHGHPVIDDLGSGALARLAEFGLSDKLTVRDSLAAGCTLVCFSGDKLICGPQAGIICGKQAAVRKLRADPFFRMFRPDKMTLAALEATLIHYINGDEYKQQVPLYRMLSATMEELHARAESLRRALPTSPHFHYEVAEDFAYTGGGALPDEALPSVVLRIRHAQHNDWLSAAAHTLRTALPAIFCRIHDQALVFDMRSLLAGEEELINRALQQLLR
jgi:L-seryl-tRNA(Ser) seleniumtransferase